MRIFFFLAIAFALCSASIDEPEIRTFEFLKGLLEGIHETKKADDLQKCLKDIDPVLKQIEKALELILNMTVPDVIKGLVLIKDAFHTLQKMLKPCIKEYEQLNKLLAALKHLDIMRVVIKILQHREELLLNIAKCLAALKKGDLFTAGKCVGDIFFKLFLEETRVLRFGIKDLSLIVKGFLAGLNQSHLIDDVEACVGKVPSIIDNIELIIDLFKKLDWKNLDRLIEAFKTILHVIEDILDSIKPCSKTPEEIDALLKKIAEIDPDKLLQKLMANSFEIVNDITEVVKSISNKKYYEIGFRLADIFYIILIRPQP